MPLSPFEVERREFGRSPWGYKPAEVDAFVDEVRTGLTELWEERGQLTDELELLRERVGRFNLLEEQLKNTLLLAQESAEKATDAARREAELVVGEATHKAREIVHTAHDERQRLEGALRELQSAEQDARQRFRALATTVLNHLDESDEVNANSVGNLRAAVRAHNTGAIDVVVATSVPNAVLSADDEARTAVALGDQIETGPINPGFETDLRSAAERDAERLRRMARRAETGTAEDSDLAASIERDGTPSADEARTTAEVPAH